METGKRFALLEQTQHGTAAEILGISEFEAGIRRSVTPEQLDDMRLELGRMALLGMV
jgi:hypothetical protein